MDGYAYLIYGSEIAESGTPHMQGFVQWNIRQRLSWCKAKLPRAHWEVMRGTAQQASNYCKKDGDWQEDGQIQDTVGGASGGKMKAENYREAIALSQIGDFGAMLAKYPAMYWNHYSTMKRIAMDHPMEIPELQHIDNEWIYGPPDTGKSYTARAENPGFYIKLHNKWWLGYRGEEVVIYDDLSRTDANWIGDFLKTWGDRYPFPAETKNSGMVIRPRRIIITSNYSPEDLFCQDEDLLAAIRRRYTVRHLILPFNWVIPFNGYDDSVVDIPDTPSRTQRYVDPEDMIVINDSINEESLDLDDL